MDDRTSTGTRRSDQPADPAVMANSRSKKPQIGNRVELQIQTSSSGSVGNLDHTLLTPKYSIRFGFWNVRLLGNPTRQHSRLRAVLNTMAEKQIQVLALAEVRCPGHGVSQIGDSVIVYSGLSADDPHRRCRGVAVVLSERVASAWRVACSVLDPVSERLLHIPLKSHTGFLSLIVVYAPTNEPKNEESVAFYQALQECVRQVLRRDMLVIMGDFNARVGNDAAMWQGTIGRFDLEK